MPKRSKARQKSIERKARARAAAAGKRSATRSKYALKKARQACGRDS